MDDGNTFDTELTNAQIEAIRKIVGNIPSIALPRGGMGFGRQPETLEHLVDILVSVTVSLKDNMRENADLRETIATERQRKAAAGEYLRDLLSAGQTTAAFETEKER